jgi:hypothetical protein
MKSTGKRKPAQNVNANVMADMSPLQLAQLTAQLVTAKLIQGDNSAHQTIAAAGLFLEKCVEVQGVFSDYPSWFAEQEALQRVIARLQGIYGEIGRVPVAEFLKVAKADRLTLSNDELRTIKLKGTWDQLTKDRRQQAIFLLLTHKPPSPRKCLEPSKLFGRRIGGDRWLGFGGDAMRQDYCANGIPMWHVSTFAEAVKWAKKDRESLLKTEAGKKSRALTRGAVAEFTAKPRKDSGRWAKSPVAKQRKKKAMEK